MRKRKIMGILKYGTRGYTNTTQKFQEGGFVAVSKGYDWRDDPYEIMLLQQKALQDTARIRNSGRKSGSSSSGALGKKIDTFTRIEGGLQVTNEAFNAITQKSQEAYYDKVTEGGPEWAASAEGQIAFQRLLNESSRLEERAIKEEKNFTEAFSKIESDEDRDTLAISTDGNLMVWDTTGKGKKISMGTYLGDVTKYKVMDIDEFATWKKEEDTQLQEGLTNEFLKKNAVGHNTLRKLYIDGKEDQIQYAFADGKIYKKDSVGGEDKYISDTSLFLQGLHNQMLGGNFYDSSTVVDASKTDFNTEVVETVYSDIMNSTAMKTQLGASLEAEILKDGKHLLAISKIEGLEKREAYLEEQKKLLLVTKVVDKNFKKSKSSGGGEGGGEGPSVHKTDASALFADINAMYDPTEVDQYVIGVGARPLSERRVVDVNMPMIRDGLNPSDLGLVHDPTATVDQKQANKLSSNKALHVYTDTTTLYLPSGERLDKILGSDSAVKQFIAEDAVIAPDETMPIVFMPMDKDKNLRIKDVTELASTKVWARQQFIASSKNRLRDSKGKVITITTRADSLLPGNMDPKAIADSNEYLAWIQKGMEFQKYEAALKADPQNQTKRNNYFMAKEAQMVITKTKSIFSNKFGGKPIQMQPMLGTWIVFDNDRFELKEAIDKKLAGGFGSNLVVKATGKEEEFLQDVNGIDNRNLLSDNVYKMMVFSRVKGLDKAAAEGGEKLEGVARYAEIGDKMRNFSAGQSAITYPGELNNIALFLKQ